MFSSKRAVAIVFTIAALAAAAPYVVPDSTSELKAIPAPKIAPVTALEILTINQQQEQHKQRRQQQAMTRMDEYVVPPPVVRELATIEPTATADMHIRAVANGASSTPSVGNAANIMTAIAAKNVQVSVHQTSTVIVTIEASAPSVGNAGQIMVDIAAKNAVSTGKHSTSTVTVTVGVPTPVVEDPSLVMNLIDVGDDNSASGHATITLSDKSDDLSAGANAKVDATSGIPCSFYDNLAELSITMSSGGCIPGPNENDSDDASGSMSDAASYAMFSISPISNSIDGQVGDEDAADNMSTPTSDPEESTFDSSNKKCVVITTTVWPSS
ncbi:hypothetical protein GGI23_005472 [Coemansia sp. RSA 2559]|nr:hypothetical protein GGI23_005472 [Coemansia sp. RSA 2559]